MMKIIAILIFVLGACGCCKQAPDLISSPNGQLGVKVFVTEQNSLAYSVSRAEQTIILDSDLGLKLTAADFTHDVSIKERSPITSISDSYKMRVGKKSHITYNANEQNISIVNAQKQSLVVTFRVSNDGVAFRYSISDPAISDTQFVK